MVIELCDIYSDLYIPRKVLGANWEGHWVELGRFSSSVSQSFPSVIATERVSRSLPAYVINNRLCVCDDFMSSL